MSTTEETPRLKGYEQIAVLQALTQQAAAALLGVTVFALRAMNPPRKADGSYDGIELHKWRMGTVGNAGELDDLSVEAKRYDVLTKKAKAMEAIGDLASVAKVDENLGKFADGLAEVINRHCETAPECVRDIKRFIENWQPQ